MYQQRIARMNFIFSTNTICENMAFRSCWSEEYSDCDVGKIVTGIIVSWKSKVHGDVDSVLQ